jgi:hypothetical protein
MTPFKEVVLDRQKSTCQPEIMCIEPGQLLGEPQVCLSMTIFNSNDFPINFFLLSAELLKNLFQVVAEFDLRWLDTSELIKIMKRVFLSVTKDGPLQVL